MNKSEFFNLVRGHEGLMKSADGLIEAINYRAEDMSLQHIWDDLVHEMSRDLYGTYYSTRYIDEDAYGQCWVSPRGQKVFVHCGGHDRFVKTCLGITEGEFEKNWVKITGSTGGCLMVESNRCRPTKKQKEIMMEVDSDYGR